ncbi:MAG: hypothetical protein COZ80_08165 [Ignavibacteria bacterium CG_4_8_14_3_um_filter_37_9]|nr:MAG: hypothetical protein AUJ54_09255 [Ignavibacteria bacterium CG1_02_37_35]PIW98911.1 MAG: hypothetical protein COZ80_08165 [Ignavibacteria bacterium CG_4_8_14_3_um_filter_37_9]PIX92806.1 MAG: hypothetical protein COZ25_14000 [Ignavibacteria bacterium CG_4_10_14_3_um_filter_37_18]PJC60692.1 MAG: hypothetical protein CO025_02545 [Ignavibacteria bacterium CG_4_9_14_0_2_um_filter_37_13]
MKNIHPFIFIQSFFRHIYHVNILPNITRTLLIGTKTTNPNGRELAISIDTRPFLQLISMSDLFPFKDVLAINSPANIFCVEAFFEESSAFHLPGDELLIAFVVYPSIKENYLD